VVVTNQLELQRLVKVLPPLAFERVASSSFVRIVTYLTFAFAAVAAFGPYEVTLILLVVVVAKQPQPQPP
jgi:hypothetical protein